jgi:menaquinol-cytochrome c reductase iron-sulfur subunit
MVMVSDENSTDTSGTNHETDKAALQRRNFLKIAAVVVYGSIAVILGLPFIKTLLTPGVMKRSRFSKVADLSTIPTGTPVDIHFSAPAQDAFYHEKAPHTVWVVKAADGSVSTFSPVCPHLGCHYDWNQAAAQFQCPCHASTFAVDGSVLGGPAPRPLDTLPQQIVGGTLYVRWVDYTPGIPKKVAV